MKDFVIIGRPNSGKTLFALTFAEYIGSKVVDITFRNYENMLNCKHMSIEEAKRELCGIMAHKTRSLQSVVLKVSIGKNNVNFKLTDTCGITEQIHPEEIIRRGMAQTLSLLRSADYLLHLIDVSLVLKDYALKDNNIDMELYNYGLIRRNYVVLANKMDLPSSKNNVARINSIFNQAKVIPISALYGTGYKEVKNCVARNL